jgi:hypothetical protein
MSKVKTFWEAIFAEKEYKDRTFCPADPTMVPFEKQLAFLKDPALTKLARCGNRGAKTFTSIRDLAWRLCRRHPYHRDWYCDSAEEYMDQKPKKWWVVAPDLTFLHDTIWVQFLQMFTPQWYYTNDDLVPMLGIERISGKETIQSLRMRNGDEVIFRSYTQSLLSKMGASVDGGVTLMSHHRILKSLLSLSCVFSMAMAYSTCRSLQ